MDKDKDDSVFDFDNDPRFSENFYKNIEKAISGSDLLQETTKENNATESEVKTDIRQKTSINEDKIMNAKEEEAAAKAEAGKTEAVNTETEKTETDKADSEKAETEKTEIEKTEIEKTETEKTDTVISEAEDSKSEKTEANITEAVKDESINTDTDETAMKMDVDDNPVIKKENDDEIDEKLSDISASLGKQISSEMDSQVQAKPTWKKRFLKIQSGLLITLLCLAGIGFFLGGTEPGNKLLIKMGINMGGTVWGMFTHDFEKTTEVTADVDYLTKEDQESTAPEVDPATIVWPEHPGDGRHEDGVYNILLLGEEAIGMGAGKGRTDSIVIATLNTNNKTVRLTSMMRDMLVQIPGYKDNKLNSAYEKGGLNLLYETISLNFGIKLDGACMVNFDNFEKIVDDIGGLDLTLKQNEADYLNHTNYISNKKYRTLVAGTQHMNGNQVLGYTRVRKTSTITGQNNDYGRTDRHRIVLNAIYDKCRTKSKTDLAYLLFKFLPMITTDIDNKNFQMLLNSYLDMGMNSAKIEQLRIPVDGSFKDNLRVRGMSVLIVDLTKNIQALDNFIFGDPLPTPTITPAPED